MLLLGKSRSPTRVMSGNGGMQALLNRRTGGLVRRATGRAESGGEGGATKNNRMERFSEAVVGFTAWGYVCKKYRPVGAQREHRRDD